MTNPKNEEDLLVWKKAYPFLNPRRYNHIFKRLQLHSLSASATWPGGGNHWTQVQWITAQTPVGLGSKGTDGEMRHCPGLVGTSVGLWPERLNFHSKMELSHLVMDEAVQKALQWHVCPTCPSIKSCYYTLNPLILDSMKILFLWLCKNPFPDHLADPCWSHFTSDNRRPVSL